MDTVNDRVKEIIAKSLRIDSSKLQPESNFIKDLQADSLDVVEMVVAMEREFDIQISNDDAESMRTVGAVYTFLKDHGHA
jgi:acyl carrier protein